MKNYSSQKGFTLTEILVVIAIIGLLVAILIPTVSHVRESAKKTQARAQFSQWISAIEMFRTEYGYWPDFNSKPEDGWAATQLNPDNNLVVRVNGTTQVRRNFIEFLSGRHADGSRWDPTNDFDYRNHPNRRRTSFYDLTENDFDFTSTPHTLRKEADNIRIVDSFWNEDIIIVMDGDQNGIIRLDNDTTKYGVAPRANYDGEQVPVVAPYDQQRDVRASVLVYSAGPRKESGADQADAIVRSW